MINTGATLFENAIRGATTQPARLFKIQGSTTLYFTDFDKPVIWNSQVYTPKGISYSKITKKLGNELDTCTITIDNIDDAMIAWALASTPIGKYTDIYKGLMDGTIVSGNYTLINDIAINIFHGRNTSLKATTEFELTVKSETDMQRQLAPRSTQDVTCRFRGINGFKGANCGYAGAETSCNYTKARCDELGNTARFGGFVDLNTKQER